MGEPVGVGPVLRSRRDRLDVLLVLKIIRRSGRIADRDHDRDPAGWGVGLDRHVDPVHHYRKGLRTSDGMLLENVRDLCFKRTDYILACGS